MPTSGPRGPILRNQVVSMSSARAAVLAAVRREGQQHSVKEISDRLDLHTNTVREHLDALVDDGLVVRESSAPVGRGRPALVYRALSGTDDAARDYELLTEVLADQISQMPDPQAASLRAGRSWGDRMLERGESEAGLDGVVETMARMGFDPTPPTDGQILLRSCPILGAARQNPDVVCTVHLGLAQSLLTAGGEDGESLGLVPMGAPGGCLLLLGQDAETPEPA